MRTCRHEKVKRERVMPKLLLYNIAYGQGTTGKKRSYLAFWRRLFSKKKIKQIGESIERIQPDIIGLVEVAGGKSHKNHQFSRLQKQLNLPHADVMCKYSTKGASKLVKTVPILRKQSNGLLSKHEIVEKNYFFLSCGVKRLVSKYVINVDSKKCTILIVHLALGKKTRAKQLIELANIANNIEGPTIIMGDFNAMPNEISTITRDEKFNNIKSLVTFPAHKPNRQLDYIITSPQIIIKEMTTLPWQLSDHLPILLDFEIA